MTRSAFELYRLGRAHLNAGRNAAARRVLLLAAVRTDDTDLQARVAGSLAALTIRQGDPRSAERLCRDALRLPGLSSGTEAYIFGQLGLLALERGDLDGSVGLLDRAIAGIGDEVQHRAPMLLNRSVAHSEAGRLAAARADLEAAAPDYAATGNDVERAMAVHNSGWIALLEGDLVHALEQMAEAHAVLAPASAVNAAICDLDRALVLRDAGLAMEAERMLERVAATFGAHRMRQARAEAELHLARSLLSHAPDRAARVADAARRRFGRLESTSWALRADAVRLRALVAATDARGVAVDPSPAAPDVDEVEAVARALGRQRLHSDAASLRLSWELSEARRSGLGTSARRTAVPREAPIQVRLLAHEVRAARAAAAGRDGETRRHAGAGLDELARWQESFGSLDLATSLVMHGRGLIYAGLAAAARSRRPEVVFDWSERARQLSLQVVPLRPSPDPDLVGELTELRMLYAAASGDDGVAGTRAAALQARVRARQWASAQRSSHETRAAMTELQEALDESTASISYVFTGEEMLAVVVTSDGAELAPVGDRLLIERRLRGLRADLDMAAAVRTGPLAEVVRASLSERLTTLSAALLDGPLAASGRRRLVITVPGILGGIPWAMLPAMRGRTFTLAASATGWVRRRHESTIGSRAGFAVGPHVARGAEEVAVAASAWPAATLMTTATVDDVAGLAGSVDVLHIAAHGRHTAENPLFSGLELADGTLFGYDIDRIATMPSTVVLSACEAGRSSVRWGEEAIGMTRSWLHAGVRAVVATPVVVADDDACELLSALHIGLAAGRSPSEALAEASARTGIVSSFQVHGSGF